jgi:hypothetical protein
MTVFTPLHWFWYFCIFYILVISFSTFNVSILCILNPWGWPRGWPKQVGVHCMYTPSFSTFVCVCPYHYFTCSINWWIMNHKTLMTRPLHLTISPAPPLWTLSHIHGQNTTEQQTLQSRSEYMLQFLCFLLHLTTLWWKPLNIHLTWRRTRQQLWQMTADRYWMIWKWPISRY